MQAAATSADAGLLDGLTTAFASDAGREAAVAGLEAKTTDTTTADTTTAAAAGVRGGPFPKQALAEARLHGAGYGAGAVIAAATTNEATAGGCDDEPVAEQAADPTSGTAHDVAVQRTAATDDVGASLEPKHDHAPTEAARELTRKARKEKKKKEKKKEKREEKKKKQPASVAAFGDAEMPPVVYPFTFVDVAGSAVATEEMKKKKQHTTTPSTGTQGEHERMARLECGPLACAAVVASLRRAAPGEHDPAGGPVYAAVLEALEVSFYDLQAQAFAGVHVAHEDCF
jgi:hypothetical protein